MAAHCSNLMLRLAIGSAGTSLAQGLFRPSVSVQQVRWTKANKHWLPKWKALRRRKVIKIKLPEFEEMRKKDQLTPEEMRSKLKEQGVAPDRPWNERPMVISCSGGVFEPYLPPEGDGKVSVLTKAGAIQRMRRLEMRGKSYMNLRKIRAYEDEFDLVEFADIAQDIYIEAHKALVSRDEDKLHDLVTEHCYPIMMANIARKTLRWQFVRSLEPPRAVHVRCTDMISKENLFGQITMRFHSQQTLAVYDRFGRLMHGSEAMIKDVLEYVVFEKHISNVYGTWRIHSKITPEWQPPKEPMLKTFVKPKSEPEPAAAATETTTTTIRETPPSPQSQSSQPSGETFAAA
ncbi:large ribosomal subunit protein mL45 [Dermacentor andersoni]|uniref:large ribosomal subunit protein mL45 n=1 Tax=Dermacentor andersoni TaxID=34620 RepID=UPI0021555D42|nr:probable 39S ribosomal protein L45, mitochondrial [Dermacentor andersoni]